jgi:hypothetical protein
MAEAPQRVDGIHEQESQDSTRSSVIGRRRRSPRGGRAVLPGRVRPCVRLKASRSATAPRPGVDARPAVPGRSPVDTVDLVLTGPASAARPDGPGVGQRIAAQLATAINASAEAVPSGIPAKCQDEFAVACSSPCREARLRVVRTGCRRSRGGEGARSCLRRVGVAGAGAVRAQCTIRSSWGVVFSRRPPSSVTVTMSSIRTPKRPGR